MSNSFHVHVTTKISGIKKMNIEAPMFYLSHGGHISYNEFPYNVDELVLEEHVDYAMKHCGLYYGANIESSTCNNCGYQQLDMNVCPECGSDDVTKIERMNGYLSYTKVKGDTRLNDAKMEEISDRKSM